MDNEKYSRASSIGIFDSGIGGLSVLREIVGINSAENICYFADNLHLPYGEKNGNELRVFSEAISDFLVQAPVKMLIVACNSASGAALNFLKKKYHNLIVIGMKPPLVDAMKCSKSKRVGVMATRATLNGVLFKKELRASPPDGNIFTNECDGLANAIERYFDELSKIEFLIEKYVGELKRNDIDVIVLGCTHYSLIKKQIEKIAGREVQIYDPSYHVAHACIAELRKRGLCREESAAYGKIDVFTTSAPRDIVAALSNIVNNSYEASLVVLGQNGYQPYIQSGLYGESKMYENAGEKNDFYNIIDGYKYEISDKSKLQKIMFNAFSIDSRTLEKDNIFFAIKGERFDGHDYIGEVLNKECAAVVVESSKCNTNSPKIFKVDDPLECMQYCANKARLTFTPLTVAVTGSVGKTTTKNVIGSLLSAFSPTVVSEKSFNNDFGVPLTLSKLKTNTKYACIEIGINHIGEMERLASIVCPDVAVLTNIGLAHIGNFGSLETTLREKARLLAHLRDGGCAILNIDDHYLSSLQNDVSNQIIWYGENKNADVKIINRKVCESYQELLISVYGSNIELNVFPCDKGTSYSILAAISVASYLGFDMDKVINVLENINTESRLKIFNIPNLKIIDDTYNASTSSIVNGIEYVSQIPGKALLVLGDLYELGDYLVTAYVQILQAAMKIDCDLLLNGGTIKEWQEAADLIGFNASRLRYSQNWQDACQYIIQNKNKYTIVYVKGSRFAHLERIGLMMLGDMGKCKNTYCGRYINCKICESFN